MKKLLFLLTLALSLVVKAQTSDEAENPLKGKIINVIGDSYVKNHRRPSSEAWHALVAERNGMTYRNYGRNGNCIVFDREVEGWGKPMLEWYKEMNDTADYVLVIAGHNDAFFVGNSKEKLQEFRDGLRLFCQFLIKKYPKAIIAFVTPWNVQRDGFAPTIRAITETCAEFSIPCLNAASIGGINPNDEGFRKQYFQGPNDTAHLNAKGHELFYPTGLQFLLSLSPRSGGAGWGLRQNTEQTFLNPVQATLPAAKNLFAYLHEIYGTKTLSATMANVNWNTDEAELVYRATGKYPAIATFDYIHLQWSPSNWIDYTNTKVAEDWWAAGGIVSACWHWNVPCTEADMETPQNMTYTPGDGNKNSDGQQTTAFHPKNIFVQGTWEQRFADESLKQMADMLLLLQDKGIPVVWRPFHEAAGNTYADWNPSHQPLAWFWWGRDGAEAYRRLWQYMFDYFGRRGLTNLIWVFTGDTHDTPFYPGDEYVDIVGCDIYNKSSSESLASQYNGVASLYPQKLVTLSEMGNVAQISAQWSAGARWLYFMPWYHYNATTLDGHPHADTNWWKDAMNQPCVISRDELPKF